MSSITSFMAQTPMLVWVAVFFMMFPLLSFVTFWWNGHKLKKQLGTVITELRDVPKSFVDLDSLKQFQPSTALDHAWKEYQHTLHPEYTNEDGLHRRIRAIAPQLLRNFFYSFGLG